MPRAKEGGRWPRGEILVAPDRRFGSKRNARLGPRLEKRVSKRARDVPSHRERASAARSLALSRTNSAPARSPRAGHLERARDGERPRRSPRDEIATDWNRIDETYQSFEEPFDGLVGQASGVRALRECEGHEGHEKDHGGSAHGYVRRDECASEARGGGVQM